MKKDLLAFEINIGRINLAQKEAFAKNLAVMLRAGISINEALSIIYDSSQGKLRRIIKRISRSVQAGNSFSSALAEYPKVFPNLFISAVASGEVSGTLEENLENIAEQLRKEKELSSKIKGAMLYPIVVLIAAFGLGIIMSFVVLPKITPLFEGLKMELPFTTRALIWFSHFVSAYKTQLLVGISVFVASFLWILKRDFIKPLTHWLVLRTPIIKNLVRNSNLARFCRNLGMLLKSGLNIDEALEATENTLSNYYYKRAIGKASRSISKGTKLSENLAQFGNVFPVMATRMIRVGEESGKIEETLFYLADAYEAEVDNATKTLSTAIEPVLLIFIGLTVGFLALSIITPIYNITGGLKK